MFTGLVQYLSPVSEVVDEPPGKRLVIREPQIAEHADIGASVAINGIEQTALPVLADQNQYK